MAATLWTPGDLNVRASIWEPGGETEEVVVPTDPTLGTLFLDDFVSGEGTLTLASHSPITGPSGFVWEERAGFDTLECYSGGVRSGSILTSNAGGYGPDQTWVWDNKNLMDGSTIELDLTLVSGTSTANFQLSTQAEGSLLTGISIDTSEAAGAQLVITYVNSDGEQAALPITGLEDIDNLATTLSIVATFDFTVGSISTHVSGSDIGTITQTYTGVTFDPAREIVFIQIGMNNGSNLTVTRAEITGETV